MVKLNYQGDNIVDPSQITNQSTITLNGQQSHLVDKGNIDSFIQNFFQGAFNDKN